MLDDVMFDAAAALTLEILSSRNSAPIYEYMFSYEAPFGLMKSLYHVEDGELRAAKCSSRVRVTLDAVCANPALMSRIYS